MKKGVILFHSNIGKIYKKRWVDKCIESLSYQTVDDFTFYEINYGGAKGSVLEGITRQEKKYWYIEMQNHVYAMNFLLDQAYNDGCDVVFNVNLDDYYDLSRFEKQIKMIEDGCDIVSSDFCYVQEYNGFDKVTYFNEILTMGGIGDNFFNKNINVIAHPCVCYSRRFLAANRYDVNLVPQEDFDLWKKAYNANYIFGIHPDILLYYRKHKNQITQLH